MVNIQSIIRLSSRDSKPNINVLPQAHAAIWVPPYPSNPASTSDSFQSNKKKMVVLASTAGATGLAILLFLTRHKIPGLKLWGGAKPKAATVEDVGTKPPQQSPLFPLAYHNEAAAIHQRHALSVKIANDLWPEILKYAEHKPVGWENALKEKYSQSIRKHLKEPYAKVNVIFDKDLSKGGSECGDLPDGIALPSGKDKPFIIGGLSFAAHVTHFNPASIEKRQASFGTLTHETDHLLRFLSGNQTQHAELTKWFMSENGHPLGDYGSSEGFLRDLIASEQKFNTKNNFPKLNPVKNGKFDKLVNLTAEQKKHYWQLIQNYWHEPAHAELYKEWHQGFLKKASKQPDATKLAVQQYYLSELEAHLLAMHRAPSVSMQVTEADINDGARALFLRQKIRAYYDYFKIPPEQQSDMVKNWKLELTPNPQQAT